MKKKVYCRTCEHYKYEDTGKEIVLHCNHPKSKGTPREVNKSNNCKLYIREGHRHPDMNPVEFTFRFLYSIIIVVIYYTCAGIYDLCAYLKELVRRRL